MPLVASAISLLEQLISTPSPSREEDSTAALIADWLSTRGCRVERQGNNVWSRSRPPSERPVVLLNSHHDTVRPAAGWATDPYAPTWTGDKLTGLGSNDAGGPLVAMLAAFVTLKDEDLGFDLLIAATAEEEISGQNGIASILPALGYVDCGIVGEPTGLEAAISEKGLVVLDGKTRGRAGHAARRGGENALYRALDDIARLRGYRFTEASETLGEVLVTVTQIEAGTQHNVVPDTCSFVVDVRTTDAYSNAETVALLQNELRHSTLTPRSLRLQPSGLAATHPLRLAVDDLGLETYGSPTLSDQALLPFPTLKFGPGDSARSHTAGEYILRSEIAAGVSGYVGLLRSLRRSMNSAPAARV